MASLRLPSAKAGGLGAAMDRLFGQGEHRLIERHAEALSIERFRHRDATVDALPDGDALTLTIALNGAYEVERLRGGPRVKLSPRPGSLAIVRPDVRTTLDVTGQPDILQMHVATGAVESFIARTLDREPRAAVQASGSLAIEPRFHVRDPGIERVMLAVATEVALGASDRTVDAFAEPLIALLLEHHAGADAESGPPHALAPFRLRRALEMIEARLPDAPSRAELAAEAGLSLHHFARGFALAMGEPPHRYMMQRRIEIAKDLLLVHPDWTVARVAHEVRFSSESHFVRAFATHVGGTPRAYRRALAAEGRTIVQAGARSR